MRDIANVSKHADISKPPGVANLSFLTLSKTKRAAVESNTNKNITINALFLELENILKILFHYGISSAFIQV